MLLLIKGMLRQKSNYVKLVLARQLHRLHFQESCPSTTQEDSGSEKPWKPLKPFLFQQPPHPTSLWYWGVNPGVLCH